MTDLLDQRDGLMLGVCNGFQALIKLGLVPFGKIVDTDVTCPTLTFNTIGRHQSRLVRTRVASAHSPWLKHDAGGQRVHRAHFPWRGPVHGLGGGRSPVWRQTARSPPSMWICRIGPRTRFCLIPTAPLAPSRALPSPDGRVLGKMGHSERIGAGLYRNVPGEYDMQLFRSAVEYFK